MCHRDELCCIGGLFGFQDVKSHHHIDVSWAAQRDAVSGRAPLDVPELARYGMVGNARRSMVLHLILQAAAGMANKSGGSLG